MKRKFYAVSLCLVMMLVVGMFGGCQKEDTKSEVSVDSNSGGEADDKGSDENKQIIIISKSYQNQFYQAAFSGAQDAAVDLGVTVITNGPDAESNVAQQVEQVAAAINQKPDAIVLAACDPSSLEEVLTKAKESDIPVIGFDSGIPGDTTGAVLATAATDNTNAGANVALNLFEDEAFKEAVMEGTQENPAVIGILAQDATSGSITQRVDGFVNAMVESLSGLDGMKDAVEVSGQEKWKKDAPMGAKVKIVVTVPPTTSQADIQSAANSIFMTDHLVAVFAANQDAVNGVISATNDATDLDKTKGKYKDILVVGFDAGKTQKEAVKNKQFYGSVTQNPYEMGYQAIELAVKASEGEKIADVDTGSKWYNSENIDQDEISILLYD